MPRVMSSDHRQHEPTTDANATDVSSARRAHDDEVQTPAWLTITGVGLFALAGVAYLVTHAGPLPLEPMGSASAAATASESAQLQAPRLVRQALPPAQGSIAAPVGCASVSQPGRRRVPTVSFAAKPDVSK